LKTGLLLGVLAAPLVVVTGHLSVMEVARDQPMKFAAFEGLWQRETGPAGWVAFAVPQRGLQSNRMEVKIPYLMSILTGNGLSGSPPGVREVLAAEELKMQHAVRAQGLPSGQTQAYRALYAREQARGGGSPSESELVRRASARLVPNVRLLFGGFRLMAAVGTLMSVLFVCGFLLRKQLQQRQYGKVLLLIPMLLPLPWLATFAGWIVAEAGRQPWVVYGYLSTAAGAKLPTLAQGFIGTVLVVSIYLVLTVIFVLLSLWWIRLGPTSNVRLDEVRSGTGALPVPATST
jgi:cytochrome d ubiquinol oxidase subunit I